MFYETRTDYVFKITVLYREALLFHLRSFFFLRYYYYFHPLQHYLKFRPPEHIPALVGA